MNKKLLIVTFTLLSVFSQAQSFFGSQHDNYAGIYSVINNPANIVDSRYKSDINIAGISGLIDNDYYAFQFSKALSDLGQNAVKSPSSANSFYTNVDALLPSFQMNIDEKSAIAVFTRVRAIGHITQIDGLYLEDIQEGIERDYSVNNQNFSLAFNTWGEVGFSYARVLLNSGKNFLKGGLSLKYLYGINTGYVKANNVNVDFDYNANSPNGTTASGQLFTGNINGFNDITSPKENSGAGFGADLGVTYELRTDATNVNTGNGYNKYLLKIGFSITDIGSINFKKGETRLYNGSGITDFSDSSDFDTNFIENLAVRDLGIKVSLPTALHINADLKLNNKFYLNLNTDFNLNDKLEMNSNFITNTVGLTPRYETKWLSLYLPMSIREYAGFQTGFGFRAGPISLGSGSIISALMDDNQAIDLNVAVRIPLFQKK